MSRDFQPPFFVCSNLIGAGHYKAITDFDSQRCSPTKIPDHCQQHRYIRLHTVAVNVTAVAYSGKCYPSSVADRSTADGRYLSAIANKCFAVAYSCKC